MKKDYYLFHEILEKEDIYNFDNVKNSGFYYFTDENGKTHYWIGGI